MRSIGVFAVVALFLASCSDEGSSPAGAGGSPTSSGASTGSMTTTTGSGGAGGDGTSSGTQTGSTTTTGTTGGSGGTGAGGDAGAGGAGGSGVGGSGGAGGSGGSSGMVRCGNTTVDLNGFTAAESLVAGPDGTIYSCSRNAVLGRFAPPYTRAENNWTTISGAQVFGIALDPKRKVLYAGARSTNQVYRIPIDDPTKIEMLAATKGSADGINGVTLGEDGAVYYGDQKGGHIWRLNPDDKMTTQVTKMPINNANGIAFAPDGTLWVLSYTSPGGVTRFKVDASHAEVTGTRDNFTIAGSGNADGIAFDKTGNAYVTAGGLWRVTPDKQAMRLSTNGGANVEFGAGALSCKLLMWAGGTVRSMMNDVEGADVPWHRQ
jgi:SMP-30/Gluconolactonase/LRE-like region